MISLTTKGLFCEAGGFYIDPSRKVEIALVTHAHSDHARPGSGIYYCAQSSVRLLAQRVGEGARIEGVPYGKRLSFGGVIVSFHPAGHILGSAQIRVEQGSQVWVASGDYKREADPTCEPFEVLECDTFITEATFGHPSYEWGDTSRVGEEILAWWEENARRGRNSLLYCYALGKTQRVLAELHALTSRKVWLYGEAASLTDCYRQEGVSMVPTEDLESLSPRRKLEGELIVAPHAIARAPWIERLGNPESAFASGWMASSRGYMRARYGRGFVLSDHADWPALVRTIEETRARQVLVQHASDPSLVRHLRKRGIFAETLEREGPPARGQPVQGDLFRDRVNG